MATVSRNRDLFEKSREKRAQERPAVMQRDVRRDHDYKKQRTIYSQTGIFYSVFFMLCIRTFGAQSLDRLLKLFRSQLAKHTLFDWMKMCSKQSRSANGNDSSAFMVMHAGIDGVLRASRLYRTSEHTNTVLASVFCRGGPRKTLSNGLSANQIRRWDRLPGRCTLTGWNRVYFYSNPRRSKRFCQDLSA